MYEYNKLEELQNEINFLSKELEDLMAQEELIQQEAIVAFETTISNLISIGASDRTTAIRWMLESDENYKNDLQYFCYIHNLPYNYLK